MSLPVTQKKKMIINCTFVKTSLMLLVIVYHSCVFWTGQWFTLNPVFHSPVADIIAKWLNSFHVYGFAFVSGYIYSYSKNELGKYHDRRAFVIIKIKRLIVPYYFCAIFWAIPIQQLFFRHSIKTIIENYILAEKPEQLWFLWMLFCVFVFASFIADAIDKHPKFIVLLVAFCCIAYEVLRVIVPNFFQVITAVQYLSIFFIGYFFRRTNITKKIWPHLLLLDLLTFTVYLHWTPANSMLKGARSVLGFILHVVGALMVFLFLQDIANHVAWEKSKAFAILSKYSMPMYLFHQQLIYFSIVLLNGKVNPALNVLANMALALFGSIIISAIMMKWRTTRMLIGE